MGVVIRAALSEHEISPLGQLLGVAEITATLIAEKRSISLVKHAQVILRLNQGKLNKHFSDAIMALILRRKSSSEDQPGGDGNYGATLSNLVALAEVIQHWREISTHSGTLPVVDTINRRIMMLERNFAGCWHRSMQLGHDRCRIATSRRSPRRELEVGTPGRAMAASRHCPRNRAQLDEMAPEQSVDSGRHLELDEAGRLTLVGHGVLNQR